MADAIKINGLDEVKLMLNNVKNGSKKAVKNTLNRTLTVTKKEAVNEITNDLNVEKKDARKTIKVIRASNTRLSGRVISRGRPLSLILDPITRFDATALGKRGTGKGYSYLIKKSKGVVTVPSAFSMKVKKGNVLSFVRVNRKIKAMYTTRIPDILDNEDVSKRIEKEAGEFAVEEMQSQIDKLIQKAR